MTSPPRSPLHAPPLPRYRYHPKTGAWRKERSHREGTVASLPSDPVPSPAFCQASSPPFESSFDYFLRSVRAPVERLPAAEREEKLRESTNAKLRQLESQLASQALRAPPKRRSFTSDPQKLLDGSPVSNPVHPIVGFASAISLPDAYSALVQVKGHALSFSNVESSDRLNRSEFQDLLALLGPSDVLSPSYADVMFATLPAHDMETNTVEALALFTLLVEHRYHPHLNVNVEALFDAFDTESHGVVPAEALHPEVLKAWADLRTFGNLRDQWQRFAAVIGKEREDNANLLPLIPALAPRPVVRAALCSVGAIYAAACSLDLEGGSL